MDMKRKAESDAPEQKEKKNKTGWIEIPDLRLGEQETRIWLHWPACISVYQQVGDQTLPPYRISLTGPRIAAIKEEGFPVCHHHHTCTCPICGDWKDYRRERIYASVSWEQKRRHKRDSQGEWQAREVNYNIDPLWRKWTSFSIDTNDVIWLRYTDEQIAERGRQEIPFYVPPGVANIILGYAYSRPMGCIGIIFDAGFYRGNLQFSESDDYRDEKNDSNLQADVVRVKFDPAVLINIEKS